MNYLKLTLSSVLQYFSDTDSIALRTTYNTSLYPTKRAIVGMIASALGYERKDPRSKELYDNLDIKYSVIGTFIIAFSFIFIYILGGTTVNYTFSCFFNYFF